MDTRAKYLTHASQHTRVSSRKKEKEERRKHNGDVLYLSQRGTHGRFRRHCRGCYSLRLDAKGAAFGTGTYMLVLFVVGVG